MGGLAATRIVLAARAAVASLAALPIQVWGPLAERPPTAVAALTPDNMRESWDDRQTWSTDAGVRPEHQTLFADVRSVTETSS